MSEERRKRQQERQGPGETNPRQWRFIIIAAVIVIVCAAGYYFLWYKRTSRLDAFAKCLTAKQAKMYGAFWCEHCAAQKEMFGSSFQYAPYIECGIKGSQSIAPVCTQAGIKRFPTWIFPDGTRVEGEQELELLSQATGCSLP